MSLWYKIFVLSSVILHDASPLKCYTCISFDCSNEVDSKSLPCIRAKEFAVDRLNEIYFGYGESNNVRICPPANAVDDWLTLAAGTPSCIEEGTVEATCSVGRFRVTTTIADSRANITSYGTALGCGRRRLLELSKRAFQSKSECSLVEGQSLTKDSLRHHLEIENCFEASEMCGYGDFCLGADKSVVKIFQDDIKYGGILWKNTFVIAGIALIGLAIAFLFFLGIKYDT